MDLAECCRQADGNAQEESQVERLPLVLLKNQIQGLTARIPEYEERPPFVNCERQRLGRPRRIEFGCERVFVLKPPETLRRRMFCGECDREERRWVAVLSAAVKGELRAFPEGLQHVCRSRCHLVPPCCHGSLLGGVARLRSNSMVSCHKSLRQHTRIPVLAHIA